MLSPYYIIFSLLIFEKIELNDSPEMVDSDVTHTVYNKCQMMNENDNCQILSLICFSWS